MTPEPDFEAFATAYGSGAAQVVWTRLIDDLETPVSAYLKIAHGAPYAFLFESVEGGTWRGRYSIVAMKPDLVWHCAGRYRRNRPGARTSTPAASGPDGRRGPGVPSRRDGGCAPEYAAGPAADGGRAVRRLRL